MDLVEQLQLGPFRHDYHQALADVDFRDALARLLDRELSPQLDDPIDHAEGSLVALHDSDVEVAECLLLRNKFRLEVAIHGGAGTSELKAEVLYDPATKSFAPWDDPQRPFYVWTPIRKQRREEEEAALKQLIDDIIKGRPFVAQCPICRDEISVVDNASLFSVHCERDCFKHRVAKDGQGNLRTGHFFTKHPALRG